MRFLAFLLILTACEGSSFSELWKSGFIRLPSSNEAVQKESISDSALDLAVKSVWEVSNYLLFTENEIRVLEENQIPVRASIKQKEKRIHLGHGSGFFISPTLMITNFHVIHNINENTEIISNRSLENGEIEFNKMELLKVSALYDLALLSAKKKTKHYLDLKLKPIEPKTDSFFLIGYPDRRFIKTFINYQGSLWNQKVISFYRDEKLGDLKGSSGGPIIDQKGRVAGVNYAGTENLIVAVSNTALEDFLNGNALDCSSLSKEDCIHKELSFLDQLANRGHDFAKYTIQFNGNYENLMKKRAAFKSLIENKNLLNEVEAQLIDSLNKFNKNKTEENQNQYIKNFEDYKQQTEIYNSAVEQLKHIGF